LTKLLQILVADDEPMPRAMLSALVTPLAGELVAVGSGDEAVRAFKRRLEASRPFELVFLDMLMPEGIDGRAALAEIRRLESERGLTTRTRAKILMTTGVDDIRTVMGSFHDECDAYLVKPISGGRLRPALRKLGLELAEDAGATMDALTGLLK
jgi:two-component system, chemotaxis family, chemotaxis protein CheY